MMPLSVQYWTGGQMHGSPNLAAKSVRACVLQGACGACQGLRFAGCVLSQPGHFIRCSSMGVWVPQLHLCANVVMAARHARTARQPMERKMPQHARQRKML